MNGTVFSQGHIVGITKSVTLENEDAQGNYPVEIMKIRGAEVHTAKIKGTYAYRMDMLGAAIRKAIEEDRKKRIR